MKDKEKTDKQEKGHGKDGYALSRTLTRTKEGEGKITNTKRT